MSNIDQRDKLVFYTEKDMKFPLKNIQYSMGNNTTCKVKIIFSS